MKLSIQNLFLVLACMGCALSTKAQTYTNLHSFAGYPRDGSQPVGGLILASNTLYGTAEHGGTSATDSGTVFKVNTDGTGFTNLYSFSGFNNGIPFCSLILSGNTLYGTTYGGGISGQGAVFAVNTDGTSFTNLYSFTLPHGTFATNNDGTHPRDGLILSNNTMYGVAPAGGISGNGTVFAVNTDGTAFTNLHNFKAGRQNNTIGLSTNSDGSYPRGLLILSGNTLYGTASRCGTGGCGTVFSVNTDGTAFTNLHNFVGNGIDGASPTAGLTLVGNRLYGTTFYSSGFSSSYTGYGTVFAINIDGTDFTNLHNFFYAEGENPAGQLFFSEGTLYGMTANFTGSVFAINTNGTGFTILHQFAGNPYEASQPVSGVILAGNTLYGVGLTGGSSNQGAVFSLSLPPPQLAITSSGTNVILTWPAYAPRVTLQSTTNLVPPAAWTTNSPGPITVNGQNVVTNPIDGAQMFYRLIQ